MPGGFRVVRLLDKFDKDFKRLDALQQEAVRACIRDLALDPIPTVRRFHCVSTNRPKIYSIDVFSNKSYKMTFEIDGQDVTLRRVARHRVIDDQP